MIGRLLGRLIGRPERTGIPESLWRETIVGLPFIARLAPAELTRLRELTEDFLASKEF